MTPSETASENNSPEKWQADILIVDDIPDNIRFLSNFLTDQAYQVRKAINGQMALRTVNAFPPDLILLDINLPDISGYDVCHQLKQHSATASIPIIFLSAGNEAIDKIKAFQAGAADYISKPFQLEEVLVRIQTQLKIQTLQEKLKDQNQQLKKTLEELKIAQTNLVQQEKMATLRKVVAGVTHEINNPLSFIACNIKPAQDYINQLLVLIERYQQQNIEPDPSISAYLNEIDLEFLVSDLMNILTSMKNGAERIRTVVLALRIFTRLDESGIKQIDIHECIDNVLALLQYRLGDSNDRTKIQIKKEFGNLPLITCHAEQLNQVIFNLLCNAIDAIDEKISSGNYAALVPEIAITTEFLEPAMAEIRIRDNGVGIPEQNQVRIFEPFFTTKPAGQGIGLGLATNRRIIEELHGGTLTCHSVVGEGAEFKIQLPISPFTPSSTHSRDEDLGAANDGLNTIDRC
ncbi:MAG: response regulator [Oscillatoriales cyanobacterium C42_A2020_001]|nr:response regulator [Leptolyngbyaceae cyanobacterium C42_A2020_001]